VAGIFVLVSQRQEAEQRAQARIEELKRLQRQRKVEEQAFAERQQVIRVKDGIVSPVNLPAGPKLAQPTGIDVDEQGHVFVSDGQGGVVIAYELAAGDEAPSARP
jgi:hypothetical protein